MFRKNFKLHIWNHSEFSSKLNLRKFKTYGLSRRNIWRVHKLILNLIYLLLRHSHNTHFSPKVGRVRNVPLRYGFVIENDNLSHIFENDDLTAYWKVVMSSDSDRQLEVIKSKIDSMYANQVWTLVDAPEDMTPIGCKWIFKKKIRIDG